MSTQLTKIQNTLELYRQEGQALANSASQFKSITSANHDNARTMLKVLKEYKKAVSEQRLNFTRVLDEAKAKVMELEKEVTHPVTVSLQELEQKLKTFLAEKEAERQAKIQAAIELEQYRKEIINNLTEAAQSITAKNLESSLKRLDSFKPKMDVGADWLSDIKERFKQIFTEASMDKQSVIDAAQELHTNQIIETQAKIQDAGEKAANTQFKSTYLATSPQAYAGLLDNYLATGGSMDKLDFLLRWAEKTKYLNEHMSETKTPIIR